MRRFFYLTLGLHWDTTSIKLKSGKHPPWFNAAGLESVSEHDLEQDVNDMPMEREARFELELEEGYHQNLLQLSAIDALLHKVTDDAVLRWLNDGPKPRNATPLSLGSRPYLTRGAARSMEAGESSRVQRGFHLHPVKLVAIDLDSNLDSDYEFWYDVEEIV